MLVDCDTYNFGCNGGDFTQAWQYLEDYGGAVNGTSYPYVSGTTQTVSCKNKSTHKNGFKVLYNFRMAHANQEAMLLPLE